MVESPRTLLSSVICPALRSPILQGEIACFVCKVTLYHPRRQMLNSFFMSICRRQFVKTAAGGVASAVLGRTVTRPKLLVLVVLEQFRPDYFESISGQLGTGGLRRALYRGAHFTDCRN